MTQFQGSSRRRAPAALPDRHGLAVEVLGFLARDDARLSRFLSLTGSTPGSLRQAAASRGFADAVLSYLAADEALLVAFASERGYAPELIGRLAQADRSDNILE